MIKCPHYNSWEEFKKHISFLNIGDVKVIGITQEKECE